jgi:pre-rRNA-processing protein TSR3
MVAVEPRILVVYTAQDDPVKNTALKMVRMGLALRINPRRIRGRPVILDPYAPSYLGSWLHDAISRHGILVYDASWKRLVPSVFRRLRGYHYRLPPLLAGNPVNYAKPCMLSSIEAVAAALYITGYSEAYSRLLGLYKWMRSFHTLNGNMLRDYASAGDPETLEHVIGEYWGDRPPC